MYSQYNTSRANRFYRKNTLFTISYSYGERRNSQSLYMYIVQYRQPRLLLNSFFNQANHDILLRILPSIVLIVKLKIFGSFDKKKINNNFKKCCCYIGWDSYVNCEVDISKISSIFYTLYTKSDKPSDEFTVRGSPSPTRKKSYLRYWITQTMIYTHGIILNVSIRRLYFNSDAFCTGNEMHGDN
ncbi:hypothetical protein AGLY_016269 [Aphis glycines]|uniref:Uncharacterized protein n=1 Tax=Aphis glycines TaxID=307491 RepID=A0A6G0T066_APHGL|nr:hypothetical protein AGLY_016269 [Aphis glycines]